MFEEDLSSTPVSIEYRDVDAKKLLSGQADLKHRFGTGILNELVVKDGQVLDEDISVSFRPFKSELLFRANESHLLERVLELVQANLDRLTSSNSCIKPLYSRPSGHKSVSGTGVEEVFLFELSDIIAGKTSLPYYLYVRNPDGTNLPSAIQILARKIRVHIHGQVYSEFKPGSISISEVSSICRQRYNEYKSKINNEQWGIQRLDYRGIQPSSGKFRKRLDTTEFDLIDLLMGRAYLPVNVMEDKWVLNDDIHIVTTVHRHYYEKGTKLEEMWSKWPMKEPSISPESPLSIFNYKTIINRSTYIPSICNIVSSNRLIVVWSSDLQTCFDRNTPIEHIYDTISRLYKLNTETKDRFFIAPGLKKHRPEQILQDHPGIMSHLDLTKHTVILFGLDCIPLFLHSGIECGKAEMVYRAHKASILRQREKDKTLAAIWVRDGKNSGNNKT